ncbi:MAG: nucleotidyltransferase domain-containing protein [Roseiflexus sp.]|jgi:predicted nucleotidyltransferase|uniref:nucleotidyltransferase domain-containing protein n=1 Tax=Roseiflexus sp. TaxID=2562120 RepID=UPI0025F67E91|nr:nucleotidyltransferase domain-containing protein [Roseiflexus sp.]MCL6540863.1 nucleotidyltransferase domain-containing protein [Roseiflexus sp.]
MAMVMLRLDDLTTLRTILRRFPAVRQARIFGARATGHAHRASDIDLAISAPDISAAEWHDLCEALECAPIIYELDIVREEDVIDEQLRAVIQRDGIVVYRSDE